MAELDIYYFEHLKINENAFEVRVANKKITAVNIKTRDMYRADIDNNILPFILASSHSGALTDLEFTDDQLKYSVHGCGRAKCITMQILLSRNI
jgi:hypothetical protein